MWPIIDMCDRLPEDWEDDKKYPEKEIVYETPESEVYIKVPEPKEGGLFMSDPARVKRLESGEYGFPCRFIYRTYAYSNPMNKITGKGCFTVAVCPKCGSLKVSSKCYDRLHPKALAGSAGIERTCEDCGFSDKEIHIQS